MLLMGLRLGEGVDLERLHRLTGVRPAPAAVTALMRLGLIEMIDGTQRVRATGSGRFILNEIVLRLAMSFAPESAAATASHPADFPVAAE